MTPNERMDQLMKKFFALTLIAACLGCALIACSKDSDEDETTAAPEATESETEATD